MGEMLSVKNINVYYGSIHAIKDVSFHVNEGEIVTLIGANGAGKTTTMHAISGLLKLQSGEIDYCGQTISKMEAHKIIRLGLAQVPEGRRVFSGLTVQQNLQMGAYTRRDGKEAIQNDFDMVFDLLPRLKERRNQPAGTLSGGEQQMLAMGRALMCKPKMLLLDEPSMGLSPLLVKEIFKIIRQVNRNGVTVLLVEQNAKMALEIANRAYVLETGTRARPPSSPTTSRSAKPIWAANKCILKNPVSAKGHRIFCYKASLVGANIARRREAAHTRRGGFHLRPGTLRQELSIPSAYKSPRIPYSSQNTPPAAPQTLQPAPSAALRRRH